MQRRHILLGRLEELDDDDFDFVILTSGSVRLWLFSLSSRLIHVGSGTGSASGGTAPGSVVMALKCDATARMAMRTKVKEWNLPQKDKCLPLMTATLDAEFSMTTSPMSSG